jgi:hypothetical protein
MEFLLSEHALSVRELPLWVFGSLSVPAPDSNEPIEGCLLLNLLVQTEIGANKQKAANQESPPPDDLER